MPGRNGKHAPVEVIESLRAVVGVAHHQHATGAEVRAGKAEPVAALGSGEQRGGHVGPSGVQVGKHVPGRGACVDLELQPRPLADQIQEVRHDAAETTLAVEESHGLEGFIDHQTGGTMFFQPVQFALG
ncbi:hypothetical protein D3C84_813250 [compost metagenome]